MAVSYGTDEAKTNGTHSIGMVFGAVVGMNAAMGRATLLTAGCWSGEQGKSWLRENNADVVVAQVATTRVLCSSRPNDSPEPPSFGRISRRI